MKEEPVLFWVEGGEGGAGQADDFLLEVKSSGKPLPMKSGLHSRKERGLSCAGKVWWRRVRRGSWGGSKAGSFRSPTAGKTCWLYFQGLGELLEGFIKARRSQVSTVLYLHGQSTRLSQRLTRSSELRVTAASGQRRVGLGVIAQGGRTGHSVRI